MTKEEFIEGWCERSGISKEQLEGLGQQAVPCDCEYEGCEHWAMVSIQTTGTVGLYREPNNKLILEEEQEDG